MGRIFASAQTNLITVSGIQHQLSFRGRLGFLTHEWTTVKSGVDIFQGLILVDCSIIR